MATAHFFRTLCQLHKIRARLQITVQLRGLILDAVMLQLDVALKRSLGAVKSVAVGDSAEMTIKDILMTPSLQFALLLFFASFDSS